MNNKYDKCYKCEKRKVGCHSTCPDYKEFRAENLKRYEENKKKVSIRRVHRERVR